MYYRYGPNGRPIPDLENPSYSSRDYTVRTSHPGRKTSHTFLRIEKIKLDTAGSYRVEVSNGVSVKKLYFKLVVKSKPKVNAYPSYTYTTQY